MLLNFIFVALLVQAIEEHLEPVLNYKLQHIQLDAEDGSNEHVQPYPRNISISFETFGVRHEYELELQQNLFSDDAEILIQDGDVIKSQPMRLTSYVAQHESGWVTATITHDGLLHAIVTDQQDILELSPLRVHESNPRQLQSEMVAFKHSALNTSRRLCGAKSSDSFVSETPVDMKLMTVERWRNCFPAEITQPQLLIGFAADVGLYKRLGRNSQAVTDYINHCLATSNTVYRAQVGVALVAKTYYIQTNAGGPSWNYDRATRCPDIDTALTTLSRWQHSNQATFGAGLWHLLTDCYPPPGTVGLGYIGTLCNSQYGAAVSSYGGGWLTVAHEIGHNFGAFHSFQQGVGKTGGIMDYGSGKYQGEFQFATPYCRNDMCRQITSALRCTNGCVEKTKCWGNIAHLTAQATVTNTCGNGLVEENEECDDGVDMNGTPNTCCNIDCTYRNQTLCEDKDNECCVNCQYKLVTSTCRDGRGYCSNGICVASPCLSYDLPSSPCSTDPNNPCRLQCNVDGHCNSLMDWITVEGKPANMSALDGSICSHQPLMRCRGGTCIPASIV